MSTKWWMGYSPQADGASRQHRRGRSAAVVLAAALLSASLAGCSLLPSEPEEEDLSAIQLPQISKKPEYEVTTKTLETKASGSGKIMSTQEKTLYFTSESLSGKRLKKLYIQAGDKVQAGQKIAELDVDQMKKDLRAQQLQFQQDELQMKQTLRQKDDMDPLEFEQKRLDFEQKRQQLADLQQDIADATLTAPFAGTVVSLSAQEGATVNAYDPICVVADPSRLVVAVSLSKDDLERVAIGMEAVVNINNAGEFKGKVKALPAPQSDNNNGGGGNGQGNGNGNIDRLDQYLLIDVPNLPKTVARGTPLSASVIVNRKENAIVIPISALRTIGARTYVQVVEKDGSKREVDVEVGQQTATDVEIVQGLTPGQKVVGR